MIRFIFAIVAITIAENYFSEATDPIREFLNLSFDQEHELVNINVVNDGLHKRDLRNSNWDPYGKQINIQSLSKDIELWLRPRDSLLVSEETPVYFSNYSSCAPGGVYIVKQDGLMKDIANRLYEDPERLASLIIGKDEFARTTFNGRIESENLVVRSLPDSVVKAHADYRRSTDHANDETRDVAYHVVYRGNNNTLEKDYPLNFNISKVRERLVRYGQKVPHTLYIKILVLLDFSLYQDHKNNTEELLIYYITFMNGVDLKYRSLIRPNFRLHIGGFVIATDAKGAPFIGNHMLRPNETEDQNDRVFNDTIAMTEARQFFYEIKDSIPLSTFDVAMTITSLQLGTSGLLGEGWIATTCRDTIRDKSLEAVTISQETRKNFWGVHIAAHELGHVLGVRAHDSEDISVDCPTSNGYIMAYKPISTENSSKFSVCSLKQMQDQIDDQKYTCFYKKPDVKARLLPKPLPGRLLSLDEQCKRHGYKLHCGNTISIVCVQLYCVDSRGECSKIGTGALEGSICSHGNETITKYCIFSQCVPL